MLQIKHLTVTHRKDGRVLLNDFSFVLRPGDRAVLIGEEGDGKSTLLKLLAGEALVDGYADYTGEIVKGGLRTGYLPQELSSREKALTVQDFRAGLPAFEKLTPGELAALARPLGLDAARFASRQTVGSLSGGEKVKLRLAGILAERPDVLLLDEPSNDLDLETLEWLERFLLTCGLPSLYVSHDETLMERTANVVIHLEQVRRRTTPRHTVARMPYRQYAAERLAALTHQEQVAREERREREKQREKKRRIESQVEHRQANISRADPHAGKMLKRKMKAVKSMERRFEREQACDVRLPDTEDAIFSSFGDGCGLPNGKTVLDSRLGSLEAGGRILARNVALRVTGPEKICIVGRNGCGKTTLLRQIAAAFLTREDLRTACMPQDYEELLGGETTPVDFLAPSGRKDEATRARTFLGTMNYSSKEMEHGAAGLSGGQKAKLLFLRMIFSSPNVLILDEPTRNFSPLSGPVIRAALRSFGGAVISVSHDRAYIAEVCDRVYRLTEAGLDDVSGEFGK